MLYEILETVPNNIGYYIPCIVSGTFGAGKTHLLRYLQVQMKKRLETTDTTLVSWVDLGELSAITDFQYLLLRGLRTLDDGFGDVPYQRTLFTVYKNLEKKLANQLTNRSVTSTQQIVLVRRVIDGFFDVATGIKPELIPGRWIAGYALRKLDKERDLRRQERELQQSTNTLPDRRYQREFLDQLIELGSQREYVAFSEKLDQTAKDLATQAKLHELADFTLRLLSRAGYTRLVIFVDELERVRRSPIDDSLSERAIDAFGLFLHLHDSITEKAGSDFPGVIQIMAMPRDLLEDDVQKFDPALYSRWRIVHKIHLQSVPQNDTTVCELVKKLCDLFELAGIHLKPALRNHEPQTITHVINGAYSRLEDSELPTMRYLISKLIKEIQFHWRE